MSFRLIIKNIIKTICTQISKGQIYKYGDNLNVNFPSRFTKSTIVGNNCHFNGIHIYGEGKVIIGNNFHSGKRIQIFTSNHNYDHGEELPYDDTIYSKDVTIGDNVWLGEGVVILGGVTIGEGCVIQNSSVVCKSIPDLAVAGGSPAKPFKFRDENHYYSLKKEGKFKK